MSSSAAVETEAAFPDLVCELDSVQGIVDSLTSVRWKRQQDAVVEISEHGIVIIVEETSCLQAKVYLQRELFVTYNYKAHGRPRFGVSLGLFVDCLNTFSVPGRSNILELQYPGSDMQLVLRKGALSEGSKRGLLVRSVDSPDSCIYAEIRTRIPETISWDYNFEPAGSTPLSFTVKSAALKEAIDDIEWPGSSIQIKLHPSPPAVVFRGEGHGDLQLYKYKFLRATTSNIPGSVIRDNRGSKLTIGRGGMLKVQHLVSVAKPSNPHPHIDSAGYQQPSRIAYIEFFVKPEVEEEEDTVHD
ncbi:hypothetical protein OROMI_020836 [Orobanche minor]